jgi:hypothetical protein
VSAPSDKEGWRYVDLAVRRHCWDQYRRFHCHPRWQSARFSASRCPARMFLCLIDRREANATNGCVRHLLPYLTCPARLFSRSKATIEPKSFALSYQLLARAMSEVIPPLTPNIRSTKGS